MKMSHKLIVILSASLLLSLPLLVACGDDGTPSPSPTPTLTEAPTPTFTGEPVYDVEIRRTEGGIPHIKAEDFASLGFGTGYAAAEDNICLLAETVVKYRAQLSRYFGPGEDDKNVNSDFFYQLMIDRGIADQELPAELDALFRGYASGYNRYLRDTGIDNVSDPACQ
ncbi:MAG: hypothetical protein HOC20_09095, partial [Chloroflexi bacterium]|nr:hypothetical protein [Chloroflexota bacterium]